MKNTRGLRNNNPLNIKRNNTAWKGLSAIQSDKIFFSFVAPEWGYRAAFITLRNYRKKHRLQTIAQWIERWAPPTENNTKAYVDCVCKRSGRKSDFVPHIYNKEQMCAIVSAMSYMENGVPAIASDVEKGWDLSISK
ncbi:MAG: structural protein P5 [Bacteroidaceae bacterium]|nr:structural protein P5 [Bacteroidaceae bacterium]